MSSRKIFVCLVLFTGTVFGILDSCGNDDSVTYTCEQILATMLSQECEHAVCPAEDGKDGPADTLRECVLSCGSSSCIDTCWNTYDGSLGVCYPGGVPFDMMSVCGQCYVDCSKDYEDCINDPNDLSTTGCECAFGPDAASGYFGCIIQCVGESHF